MSDPRRRALILVHEPDGGACQVEARLRERGFETDNHLITAEYDKPNDAAPFPELDDYDLLVPMGSVRSLTEKDEISSWIHDEIDLVRDAHEQGMPVLGVCFGGQIIAEALGGSVEKAPVTEIGWYELTEGPDGPNPVGAGPWMAWHHDRFTAPPGAEVLAETPDAVHLIRIGSTVGTQFHPEVDVSHVKGFLSNATDEYLHENGVSREEILAGVEANEANNIEQCHALVDWFLDEVAFPAD